MVTFTIISKDHLHWLITRNDTNISIVDLNSGFCSTLITHHINAPGSFLRKYDKCAIQSGHTSRRYNQVIQYLLYKILDELSYITLIQNLYYN